MIEGAQDWNGLRRYTGNQFVTVGQAGNVNVNLTTDSLGQGVIAEMACWGGGGGPSHWTLEINTDRLAEASAGIPQDSFYRQLGRHEFAHAFNLKHSGLGVSNFQYGHWPEHPAMMTCMSPSWYWDMAQLNQDDAASAAWANVDLNSGGWINGSANMGMEATGTRFHWSHTAGIVNSVTGGANNGNRYVQFKPNGVNDQFFQRIRIRTNGRYAYVRPMSNIKKLSSNHSKSMGIRMAYRGLQLSQTTTGCHDNPSNYDGRNENTEFLPGIEYLSPLTTKSPTTTWDQLHGPGEPGLDMTYINGGSWDAYEFRIYLTSSVVDGNGDPVYVGIDDVRLGIKEYTP